MKYKRYFFSWILKLSNKTMKKTVKNNNENVLSDRCFYRGFNVENKMGSIDTWKVKVKWNFVVGELDEIKECIDCWLDMKTFYPLSELSKSKYKTLLYKKVVIINDSPNVDCWYFLKDNTIYKGTLNELKDIVDHTNVR